MLIGITGGIGSGKSTIAAELSRRGYAVYSTDAEAKRIIVENPMVRSQIELLFGSEVYEGDRYCTDRVAKIVFRHPAMLERLNAIVHPAVAYDLRRWYRDRSDSVADPTTDPTTDKTPAQAPDAPSAQPLCFVESAILFESGLSSLCDRVVAVVAPESVRIERTLLRDYKAPFSAADRQAVRARIHAQMSDAERFSRADRVLTNDGKTPIAALADRILADFSPAPYSN